MRLVVGLGNPGDKYKDTLHNVGFLALDKVHQDISHGDWQSKHKGSLSKGIYKGHSFLLLKPLTFMNVSGQSVLDCFQFYKLDIEDILIVSDDIDRPAGTLRYRSSGGHGGHNGLRSIVQSLGSNRFARLKIGIGRPENSKMSVADYVLSKPGGDVWGQIDQAIQDSKYHLLDFIEGKPVQIPSSQS